MMKKKTPAAHLLAAGLLLSATASAQVEYRSPAVLKNDIALFDETVKAAPPEMAGHLRRIGKTGTEKELSNAIRTARAAAGATYGPFVWHTVPALSENQYLPDAYPADGRALAPVKIILARGEYEPGSFVIYPLRDLGEVRLSLTGFKAKDGTVFPASALDLKVVKVWYQNKNAWYNYFGDTELKLVPELLLNDEKLIRVDTKEKQNYARLREDDGTEHEVWISAPRDLDTRFGEFRSSRPTTFMPMKRNFRDAAELQSVRLQEGAYKQFFLTAHAPVGQKEGFYHGEIVLTDASSHEVGRIPVTIRVLPFELPEPKTYFDLKKEFLCAMYGYISLDLIAQENGGDLVLADRQLKAVLKNLKEHNQNIMKQRTTGPDSPEFRRTIELMKETGMRTDLLFGGRPLRGYAGHLHVRLLKDWYLKNMGHVNVFLTWGDEPGAAWVMNQRPLFGLYQEQGFKFQIAGSENVLFKGGYFYDFFTSATLPEDRNAARPWNEIGHAYVSWYARHHVGPENPAYNRREYGLAAYLSNYSAACNYAHHFGPWNDRSVVYRPMVFAYGIYDGVVDTIQWEGFREGIDDIRYATLMKLLAEEAENHPLLEVRNAGREAKQFLALQSPEQIEPESARLEMIARILKLRALLKK